MDRNTLLAFALSMAVFSLWAAWQGSQQPPPEDATAPSAERTAAAERAAPGAMDPSEPGSRDLAASGAAEASPEAREPARAATPVAAATPEVAIEESVFETSLYRVHVSNRGAGLARWELLEPAYADPVTKDGAPMELLQLKPPYARALVTPFEELGLGSLSDVNFEIESKGDNSISYVHERDGLLVRKTFGFEEGSYEFRFSVEVHNGSNRIVTPRFAVEWPATISEEPDFRERSLVAIHDGDIERTPIMGIGSPGFFGSLFGNSQPDQPELWPGNVDWAGVDDKYFIQVLLPDRPREASAVFEPLVRNETGATLIEFDAVELRPGQSVTQMFRGFSGPKEVERLDAMGALLGDSVNVGYSWVSPLTRFFQWLLKVLYSFVGNYGVAIIIITILVRLITLPIMSRQMKSMEGMRALQPKIQELQAKYADDRQKQSEEMMKLYRQEGVNPLGGCLPLLLQFPVFIGLFFALQSSIDLRHAEFIWWINDLSAPENLFTIPGLGLPFRLLPLLMGASMVIQQRMTPMTGMDPAQAKMMMTLMPIMMTVMFYQFPSGLVLYWFVSNLLGIAHQLWVRRNMDEATS